MCDSSDITKNSHWREKSTGHDRVKVEYISGSEIIFRDADGGDYGTKGRMKKSDFLEKFVCVEGDPENIQKYSEWKEKDAYRDKVEVLRTSSSEVVFIDRNDSDYGVETKMSTADFLDKFKLVD